MTTTLIILLALGLLVFALWPDPYEAPHPAHRFGAEADASAERYEGQKQTPYR